MDKCEICRDSKEDHDFIGSDHISKRNEITQQLLEACKAANHLINKGNYMFECSPEAEVYAERTLLLLRTAIAAAEGE